MNKLIERKGSYSKLYRKWINMKSRCFNTKTKSYMDYGGRGITVCKEWNESFESFKCWALENGYDAKLELDRTNNDGSYGPTNCRFVTGLENLKNRRRNKSETLILYNGMTKNIGEWASYLGINKTAFYDRYKRGDRDEKLMRKVNPAYALGKKKAVSQQ